MKQEHLENILAVAEEGGKAAELIETPNPENPALSYRQAAVHLLKVARLALKAAEAINEAYPVKMLIFAALLLLSACGGESKEEKAQRRQIEVDALNIKIKGLELQNMIYDENRKYDSIKALTDSL
jgi:hypothetical protein